MICFSPREHTAPCTRYQRVQNQGCSWHIGCPPGDVTCLNESIHQGAGLQLPKGPNMVPPPPFPPKLGDKNSWYSWSKNSQNDTYRLMAELSQHPKTQKALKRAPNWPLIILFWGVDTMIWSFWGRVMFQWNVNGLNISKYYMYTQIKYVCVANMINMCIANRAHMCRCIFIDHIF